MSQASDQSDKDRSQYGFNITLAMVAGQVGCLTIIIVLAALFVGLWLDNQFASKPMFTIGLVLASVPITLISMIWVVRLTTSRIENKISPNSQSPDKEDHPSE